MLEKIFFYMNLLVEEKDFYKSLVILTDLGRTLVNSHRASFWYRDEKKKQYWTMAASGICMPVTNSLGDVIGAYQVINKLGDENEGFNETDVKYLALAAGYCGKLLEMHILKEQSFMDQLTGLKNRRGFYDVYNDRVLSQENDKKSSVIICDIDFFKKVNDTYGHNAGDAVLVHVADILQKNIENIGEVFRWGGEEFIILLPDADLKQAVEIAQSIRIRVEESECCYQNVTIKVTMSFGVIQLERDKNVTDNIQIADYNLYRAKQEGRNRVIS